MPVNGAGPDPRLLPLLRSEAARGPALDWFDAHTHMGENDPDGRTATPEEILAALDEAGQRRALIFAMHEPGGYPAANDAVLAACAASGGRLVPLARIDPGVDPVAEAERCLAAGARGFKLHPRSDAFPMPHPGVEELVRIADARRLPVLFHAGRGIPHLGEAVTDYARRYPGARLILAHAGISDLGALDRAAAELPNLFFDMSWWLVTDQLQLLTTIPPGRILYGSDAPYGPPLFAGWATLRMLRAVGLPAETVASICGGQIARLVVGEEPVDLGPPPGEEVLGPRHVRLERVLVYQAMATVAGFRGGDPTEPLSLAAAACLTNADDEEAALLAVIARLTAAGLDAAARHPGAPAHLLWSLCALTLAGTPQAGVPALGELDLHR